MNVATCIAILTGDVRHAISRLRNITCKLNYIEVNWGHLRFGIHAYSHLTIAELRFSFKRTIYSDLPICGRRPLRSAPVRVVRLSTLHCRARVAAEERLKLVL